MDISEINPPSQTARRGFGSRSLALSLLAALALGAIVAVWAGNRLGLIDIRGKAAPAEQRALTPMTPAPAPSAAGLESAQAALGVRIAELEQRMTKLNLQADAASGDAARAEGLLIAAAARRTIERGAELGFLADQLNLRFGNAQPNAVQTLIEVSAAPVTLDTLEQGLAALEPTLVDAPRNVDILARIGAELSNLFVIRKVSAPSPAPDQRYARARMFLDTGRTEAAIGEVERMPGHDAAREWLAQAQRYVRAQRALDLIETAAILEPQQPAVTPGAAAATPPSGAR